MNSIESPRALTLLLGLPGEIEPLRTGPHQKSLPARSPDQLRYAFYQRLKPRLAFAQRGFHPPLLGDVVGIVNERLYVVVQHR